MKIDLKIIGTEKLRLGEDLIIMKKVHNCLSNIGYGYCLKNNSEIVENIANSYDMYKIRSTEEFIVNVISRNVDGITLLNLKSSDKLIRKELLEKLDSTYRDFIVDVEAFKFFNEKVWPKIVNAFFADLNSKKENLNFFLNICIPQVLIRKIMKESISPQNANKEFIESFDKWLAFNLIGGIENVKDEDENVNLKIEVGC